MKAQHPAPRVVMLASGPGMAGAMWLAIARDVRTEVALLVLPFAALPSGLPISAVAVVALFLFHRWRG